MTHKTKTSMVTASTLCNLYLCNGLHEHNAKSIERVPLCRLHGHPSQGPIWTDHLDFQPRSYRSSWQWAGRHPCRSRGHWQQLNFGPNYSSPVYPRPSCTQQYTLTLLKEKGFEAGEGAKKINNYTVLSSRLEICYVSIATCGSRRAAPKARKVTMTC